MFDRLLTLGFWLAFAAMVGGFVFLAAGRWDLPIVWAFLGLLAMFGAGMAFMLPAALLRERRAPGPGSQDRLTGPLSGICLVSHWMIAGLDAGRFHWSAMPTLTRVAGLAGYAASLALILWAMRANPFYSSSVRLQADRGQRPVGDGPYRHVRHPGYTGSILGALAGGLALGSWPAMIPILGFVGLFLRRTMIEDRLLRRSLPGYDNYARQVRYRILSGVF